MLLRGLVVATAAVTAVALAPLPNASATPVPPPPTTGGTTALGDFPGRPQAPQAPAPDSVIAVTNGQTSFRANSVVKSMTPLFPQDPSLSRFVVVHVKGDAAQAAKALRTTPGVSFAEPDTAVSSMATGATPLPSWAASQHVTGPDNYGVSSSLQSFLNANGVNALGAYDTLGARYGQLPGAGEIITNVSIGDLTDAGMGDAYVKANGPTTVVQNGQRYLDIPSMPLIPTYTSSATGALDPTGSAENLDPGLGEVLLDFGVMAPLPHSAQRPGATGSGATDLLGIAPGAQYRLVVPQQPTTDQIAVALLAAARQNPRPNVITASLGVGTDAIGYPGRYLEDDPVVQAVVSTIVRDYHIVVCISSNDGTRLFTPTAVGPDGGSTPTDTTRDAGATTDTNDDGYSTTPSEVLDSGAFAVGGTTLDDTLAAPGSADGTYATTRTDGGGLFSSGFGTRVDLSAPSDGIPAFEHTHGGGAQAVTPVLNGGTSASAPMTAAAAAVVLQAARLAGKKFNPDDVRRVLADTGRSVPTPPQIDRQLHVGNQIDLTAAVDSVLSGRSRTAIQRISVAHRVTTGDLGGEFTEATDPNRIDLQTGGTGEGLVGPVTIGADITGSPAGEKLDYVVTVNGKQFHADRPAVRITPTQLLQAAGLPVVATADRSVPFTFQVRDGRHVLASAQHTLTVGPTDGTFAEAPAPTAPATVHIGSSVKVHYDLTGVRKLNKAELVVSTVGHWNPALAPIFSAAYKVDLTATSGGVTIPASAFDDGGGLYGIGIVQDSTGIRPVYGEFSSIRVDGGTAAQRPAAPILSAAGASGHSLAITRAQSTFSLGYDVRGIPGATGAAVEFSAPAPSLFNSFNTVTNADGTGPDNDGVDSGSSAFVPLHGRNGTARLDAAKLGVVFSDVYNVRVIALGHNGKPVGEASPTSALEVDDGFAPGSDTVANFAVRSSGDSVVVTVDPSGTESVRDYTPATGAYGPVIATGSGYTVLGVAGQRDVLLHNGSVEIYDTGKLVATLPLGAYRVVGGRVDAGRQRAAILVHHNGDNADFVLPVDIRAGTLGQPIAADSGVAAGTYGLIDIDQSTGVVYLAKLGGGLICFAGGAGLVAGVNLDTRAVTPAARADGCSGAIGTDSGTLYQLSYRSFSVNINGTTNLIPIPGGTLVPGTPIAVRTQPSLTLAVDAVHHLAVVAFQTPPAVPQFGAVGGLIFDNNATSQLAVVDLTTGKTVSTVKGFAFTTGYVGPGAQRGVQLDPTTRTGWTFTSDGRQVQQFSY